MVLCTLCNATVAMSLPTNQTQRNIPTVSKINAQARDFIAHGRYGRTEELLDKYLQWPYEPDSLPLLRARAELYKHSGNYVSEAADYQQILRFASNDKDSLRGRAFAALNMGAPHLALNYAEQSPEVFSQAELLAFQQAGSGRSIKWGTLEGKAGLGQQRFQATDKALLRSENVQNLHRREQKYNSQSERYTEFDRLVALRDRMRMDEVLDLYQIIKHQKCYIPTYALAAVADAYLHERNPEAARGLYLQALSLSKNDRDYPNREWQLKLVEAYIDNNEFDAAQRLIDHLVATIPPILNRGLRGVEVDNEFYEEARVNQILARLHADQLNEGQELLDKALKSAPYNLDVRLAKGDLFQFRGQPRAAQRQYAGVLVDDPGNSPAATGIAETAIALNDTQTAKHHLGGLVQYYPENREVQRINQLFHAYNQPLFTIASGWGSSPTGGGRRGNQNWQVDSLLYSGIFNQHWRVLAHAFNAEADFDEKVGRRGRLGIGLDYKSPLWQVSGEINQDQTRFDHYGSSIGSSWTPDDHWLLNAKFESNSNNIPLQAAASGIRMCSLELGIGYNHNESRNLSAAVSNSWLSDNNNRIEASAGWQERWRSGPIYKLDTLLTISGSHNSLSNADYFNPQNDFSIDAQMINEWTLWRSYQRSFKQRLVLGAGEYWQQGFASGMTSTLRYEQEVNLDPFRTLSYGVAYERHPFDGELNESTLAFLNLSWHL